MKLTKLLIFTFVVLIATSCIPTNNNGVSPTADFSANIMAINLGDSINFNDLSSGSPTSWAWEFQGGTPSSSTLQNPRNIHYNIAGTYNVTLVVTNASGNNSKTKTAYIVVTNTATNTDKPSVNTLPISNLLDTSALTGGNITDIGGSVVFESGVCWDTSPNPTISNNFNNNNVGFGQFISTLFGLKKNTKYYVRAYAINSFGISYGNEISFITPIIYKNCGFVTDYDNNVYNTVTIGSQCWMTSDLKTTRYNDGTNILSNLTYAEWRLTNEAAYCIYNDDISFKSTYGCLYNFYAVNSGKLAPEGWHVATLQDYNDLVQYLGGVNIAGGSLKFNLLWNEPNIGANNCSGFTAYPSGYRQGSGEFQLIGEQAYYWTSTYESNGAYVMTLSNQTAGIGRVLSYSNNGFSVRCVKD